MLRYFTEIPSAGKTVFWHFSGILPSTCAGHQTLFTLFSLNFLEKNAIFAARPLRKKARGKTTGLNTLPPRGGVFERFPVPTMVPTEKRPRSSTTVFQFSSTNCTPSVCICIVYYCVTVFY